MQSFANLEFYVHFELQWQNLQKQASLAKWE